MLTKTSLLSWWRIDLIMCRYSHFVFFLPSPLLENRFYEQDQLSLRPNLSGFVFQSRSVVQFFILEITIFSMLISEFYLPLHFSCCWQLFLVLCEGREALWSDLLKFARQSLPVPSYIRLANVQRWVGFSLLYLIVHKINKCMMRREIYPFNALLELWNVTFSRNRRVRFVNRNRSNKSFL